MLLLALGKEGVEVLTHDRNRREPFSERHPPHLARPILGPAPQEASFLGDGCPADTSELGPVGTFESAQERKGRAR